MQRFQSSVHVLGIEICSVFDTIRRDKLITVREFRNLRTSEPQVFWKDIWSAVHTTSHVKHGCKYMLANSRTESDRMVRKKGGSLKRVTSTNERGNLYSSKGSSQTII